MHSRNASHSSPSRHRSLEWLAFAFALSACTVEGAGLGTAQRTDLFPALGPEGETNDPLDGGSQDAASQRDAAVADEEAELECTDAKSNGQRAGCDCAASDVDADGDGVADCSDLCPEDADKIEPGACGCGTRDADRDRDGVADCIDACPENPGKAKLDVCGCGRRDEACPTGGRGLVGTYFESLDFQHAKVMRVDDTIDLDFKKRSDAAIDSGTFSVVWQGAVRTEEPDEYRFHVSTGGDARLWVDGQLVVERVDGPERRDAVTVRLSADRDHDIRLAYRCQGKGETRLGLYWWSNRLAKELIPNENLRWGDAIDRGQ